MNPFVVKPGETVVGLGLNFVNRLAAGETIVDASAVAGSGVVVENTTWQGSTVFAQVKVEANQVDGSSSVNFTVTGSAGSVRKGSRSVTIRAASE